MSAMESYVYASDDIESDESSGSNVSDDVESDESAGSTVDDYQHLDKKPRLDHCQMAELQDFDQIAHTDGLLDTSGACVFEIDANQVERLHNLDRFLSSCRRRMVIRVFDHPGDQDEEADGGPVACDRSKLAKHVVDKYSAKALRVINQYNNKLSNPNSELHFLDLIRLVYIFPVKLYITFTACQKGNGQTGTYQAAVYDAFCEDDIQLVLLRHVQEDKVLAIRSISGAEEELKNN